jgi:hypothetical protein
MMLLGDNKKLVQLILSESHAPKEKEVPQGLEGDFSKAHESIAKELIEAIKSGDPRTVSRSLKTFMQMCEKEEEYSVEEGE